MNLGPNIYCSTNCNTAYQLNWTLTVFGKRRLPPPGPIIEKLIESLARDSLRVLEQRQLAGDTVQFFISSQPQHSPAEIIRAVKGRWQYIVRDTERIEFCRNYRITSCGSAKSKTLDAYVAGQTSKHLMADVRLQAILDSLQFHDPIVEVAATRRSSYGEYTHALQIVLETADGWSEYRPSVLETFQQSLIAACKQNNWSLSRIGLLSNHVHILLAAGISDSPESVALTLLNRLAETQNGKPMFKYSYYVGTFGEYDRGAIWNALNNEGFIREHNEHYTRLTDTTAFG